MIKAVANYFANVPPMFLDGMLYCLISYFTVWVNTISSEDAAKYIEPQTLFYLKAHLSSIAQAFLAIKLFRSTSYADHKAAQKEDAAKVIV